MQQNTKVKYSPERILKDRTVTPHVERDPVFAETSPEKAVAGRTAIILTQVNVPMAGKGAQNF
jgi:hypothetical protein